MKRRVPVESYQDKVEEGKEESEKESPKLEEINPDHYVSCHFTKELSLQGIVA